ncbi:MAG: SusC/RagA family TonB-linked outer membrane protein, partial [Flavobacteriaceae bacterium]|nr:SusC/RagA family TonB-linked outer membrane protein [Flavobacteriaceae bacterium]
MKNITSFLIMLLCCSTIYAQQVLQISGTVSDASGNPLPGASVVIKNTTTGTVTDFDGNYALEYVPQDGILVFSYIGFTTVEEKVNGRTTVDVILLEDAQALDEVVVVGYGTTKKADLTGSIISIKSDEILKQPALTPVQSLQGKAAGLQIITSGAPGSSPVVRIRGTGTVQSGRNPIYVVDGIITNRIDNINSNDILSMDILKDASSLAIYGSRGANGVIMVTTKSGKDGKMKIDVSSYFGIKDVLSKVNMADAASFVSFSNIAFGTNRFPENQEFNTDWLDEITRTGTVMNHNISISGGNEKTTAFFSANYFEEEGVLIGNDYRRLNLRNKVTYNITPKLKFEHNISLSLNRTIPKPQSAFTTA